MTQFIIKSGGFWVSHFESLHLVISVTSDRTRAKTFKTAAAAQRYIDKYADCGYGMVKRDCSIEPL